LFDPQSIAGDPHERVTIRLRNRGVHAGQCLTLIELANGGGSYGPLGGAQVALGHCSAESAKWVVDVTSGTAKSLYFWNNTNEQQDHSSKPPPQPSEVAVSRTVCMTTGWPFLQMGAFFTPNGTAPHTIVILNEAKDAANYAVTTTSGGGVVLTGSIPSRSIQTILLDQR
jgi:glucosylceramidase